MTATTVENNKELECVDIELKKAILTHQDSLHVELKKIQQRIKELGEKQKSIIATLRKENETKCRVEITSNGEKPQIHQQKTQVALPNTAVKKPFIVSKTEANSSNNNSSNGNNSKKLPQPALAVRTISGQTKLLVPVSAAVATAKKQNQHQQILVVPTPGGGARLATNAANSGSLLRQVKSSTTIGNSNNSNGNCKSILSSSKCNVTLHSNHATVISQQAHVTRYQLMIKEQHAKEQQEELKIPEPKRKESFLAALGLVTKEALSEIQNKKCERKRRTTANPQFSNAAIEAKRITALEMAAKRAKRRMMLAAANAASNKPNTSRNYLQTSTRITRVVEQSRQKTKVEVVEKAPSNSNNYNSSVTISSSRSLSCSKVSNNCFVCDEHCDPDLDAVMFCKDCRCLFHATCASNIDDITKTMSVPCPKCDKQKPLDEEVRQNDSSSDETKEEGVVEEAKVTRVQSTKERKKLEFLQKVEKRENLKRKRNELQEECDSLKKRLSQLKEDLSVKEEKNRVDTESQEKVSRSLQKLINVIELYKKDSNNSLQNGDSTEKSPEKQDICSGNETIGSKASEECAAADMEPTSAKVIPAANPVILVEKVDQFEDEVSAAVAAITKMHEQHLQIEVDL